MRELTEYIQLVACELEDADEQHGEPQNEYEMLAILGEEYGELQKAVIDFNNDEAPLSGALNECIQVAKSSL